VRIVELSMTFLDCPAWLDDLGINRCGLPAHVRSRFLAEATDGPLECVMIRCPVGHWFNGPIGYLGVHGAAAVAAMSYEPEEI
jgi:hypothetical protein